MRAKGANGVGRFSVEFEVANNETWSWCADGLLPADQVRRETIRGRGRFRGDKAGAAGGRRETAGSAAGRPIKVRYADGRQAKRKGAEGVYVQLLGRHGTFTAICEPKRETALIGAIVLEDLDLLVDCVAQRVIPRDPSGDDSEIE